ncbi:PAS domain-containing protein [Streptomyces sp. NPDC090112]|uniref:PAS domain-containing protein n=1 Tax=Streptomyces sp. NPDC090112 TaxID=3365949 RepID=UPI0037F7E8CE
MKITSIVGGERLRERVTQSPAIIRDGGVFYWDKRYFHHPDIISHMRARAGELVKWQSSWGGRVEACAVPATSAESQCNGVIGAAFDLNALENAECRKSNSENLLFALLEQANFGAAILNVNNHVLFANDSFLRLTGSIESGIPGRPLSLSEADQILEVPSATPDGENLTIRLIYGSDMGESNPPSEDANFRVLSREGVEDAIIHRRYEEAFRFFPKPVAILDPEWRVESANEAFLDWAGLPEEKTLGTSAVFLFSDIEKGVIEEVRSRIESAADYPARVEFQMNCRLGGQGIYRAQASVAKSSAESHFATLVISNWEDVHSWVDSRSKIPHITATDRQILELLARGENNAQIASGLHLSRQGLDYRLKNLRDKFKAPNKGALIGKAYAEGLFQPGVWPPQIID